MMPGFPENTALRQSFKEALAGPPDAKKKSPIMHFRKTIKRLWITHTIGTVCVIILHLWLNALKFLVHDL